MRAEGVGELEGHVAEAAETDDADLFAGADAPVAQRRVGGDAGAEQRRGCRRGRAGREGVDEVLGRDDVVGVAAVGALAVRSVGVVGVDGAAVGAVDFEVGLAVGAVHAALDDDADGGEVAGLEARDGGADGGDAADDLVAGDHGEEVVAPLAADLVDVGVADAAVVDGEDDVVGVGLAAVEVQGGEGGGLGGSGVSRRIS